MLSVLRAYSRLFGKNQAAQVGTVGESLSHHMCSNRAVYTFYYGI